MRTIKNSAKSMVLNKLQELFNLFIKVYPELTEHVECQYYNKINPTPERIYKVFYDVSAIYNEISTQTEKNKLIKSNLSSKDRPTTFIKNKYPELFDIDNFYCFFAIDKIREEDLLDMNKTYKELKLKLKNIK